MAIDRNLISVVPVVRFLNGEMTIATAAQQNIRRSLPGRGEIADKTLPIPASATSFLKIPTANSRESQVAQQWNKHLNDLGQPNRFRVDPRSGDKLIQEINPATGEIIGEYSVSTFPALAKSLGLVGSLVDRRA